MKLTCSCYTILIIVISVDCGLVKQFFGNVKEDVHTVVEGTVSVIGKGTHKITEGLGQFLHRNEGAKFPGPKKDEYAPFHQVSNYDKTDVNNNNSGATDKGKETAGEDKNYAQNFYKQSTPATPVEHSTKSDNYENIHENTQNNKATTESNIKTNDDQHEVTNNNEFVIHEHTMVPTVSINAGTTTETPWFNGVELENILPTITHNETHFTASTQANNEDGANHISTNELGSGENLADTTNIEESNHKTAKCDEDVKPNNQITSNKDNLVSDQMFFKDNKPKADRKNSNYVCADGLVRAANGDCLKQVEIDVRKKVEPLVANIFQADVCPSGFGRALDGSCQKIIG